MKRLFSFYILLTTIVFPVFFFSSCEKEIDLELRSVEPRVVIEALLRLNEPIFVNITTSKDFDTDNDFPPLFGAIITLSDSDGNSEILEQNSDGFYMGRGIKGKERKTYYLHISLNGEEYTSVSTMPQRVKLENINMYRIPAFDYPFPQIVFQDPAGEDNYYRAKLYINEIRMDIGRETVDDFHRDGVLIERVLPVFDDDKENSRKIVKGDTIFVEFQTLDKGAFTFFDTYAQIGISQNNPTSNIEGDALGYFSTYTVDYMQVVADWDW